MMVGPARSLALALAAIALATARAHIPSNDNILRIQLWDAEGLSRDPITTQPSATVPPKHKLTVDLGSLNDAMLQEWYGSGRFTRHRVRHKRRRPRHSGDFPWKFHSGGDSINVLTYDPEVPWNVIETETHSVKASAVSDSASFAEERDVAPPMTLRLPQDEEEQQQVKQLPVVPKCCPSGQNITMALKDGKLKSSCKRTSLTFQPQFFQSNESHMWSYDSNVYETIVGTPCTQDRFILEPDKNSKDEFYLLVNGSLFLPYYQPYLMGTKDFCMETFWNASNPAGITLPVLCLTSTVEESKATLIAYAIGLIISVPFLLATACVYLFITVLRDTHGKALACHTICLAIAFSCLATTQLGGHAFPVIACTVMAYLIQFSFVSCFFWLNVMCFDTFLNVRRYINSSVSRRSMRRRFAWYCAYAVLLPVVLLVVTIAMELSPAVPSTYLKPNFGVKSCWFKTDKAALPYFYGPVAVILISNLIIFFFTARALAVHYNKLNPPNSDYSTSDDWVRLNTVLGQALPTERTSSPPRELQENFNQRLKKYRKIFRTCCMLSVIMGLSWVLEVVSWAVGAGEAASVWSVFDLINALQGVVIFSIFVLQQPVRSLVKSTRLFSTCRRTSGSEVSVVSDRNNILPPGRRDYV